VRSSGEDTAASQLVAEAKAFVAAAESSSEVDALFSEIVQDGVQLDPPEGAMRLQDSAREHSRYALSRAPIFCQEHLRMYCALPQEGGVQKVDVDPDGASVAHFTFHSGGAGLKDIASGKDISRRKVTIVI